MSLNSQHAKNEHLFSSWGRDIVANMVLLGDLVEERKRKFL
jgi:hypothetical protein